MTDFLNELSLDLPEDIFKKYICPKHKTQSHINNYCEKCIKEEHEEKMIKKTLDLYLSQIDPEFKDKLNIPNPLDAYKSKNKRMEQIKSLVEIYIQNNTRGSFEDRGLIFCGNQGNGKSMLSNIIQLEAMKAGLRTTRITQFKLYNDLLESRERYNDYIQPDFLFLDELGRINNSEYAQRLFFDLVNQRYSKKRQTIFTTNLKVEDIGDFIDKDRLKEFKTVLFYFESERGK